MAKASLIGLEFGGSYVVVSVCLCILGVGRLKKMYFSKESSFFECVWRPAMGAFVQRLYSFG